MRLIAILLPLVVFGAFSLPAAAGDIAAWPITVNPAAGTAYGTLSHARYRHTGAFLSCEVAGDQTIVSCRARDAAGTTVDCRVHADAAPSFLKNVGAMSGASFVALYWDPLTSICTDMRLANGSAFLLLSDLRDPNFGEAVVAVDNVHGRASAYLIGAHLSDNANDHLQCEVWASGAIRCSARDQDGALAQCNTTEDANPKFAAGVRSINDASYVSFHFDPATLVCSGIDVTKGSQYMR
jgi:hypothetical protein